VSIALSLNSSALYLGVACGSLLGGYVVRGGDAGHLAFTAGGGGALALLLLGASMVMERKRA
jgi:predicted MFS family arabinose efflux permease